MPLEILVILVAVGISGIALVLHLSGRSRRKVLSHEDAISAWHRHFPDDAITDAVVSGDGHAALVLTEQGPGLLWAFGADTVGRRLLDYDLIDEPKGLRVIFHDYAAPSALLHLDENERKLWQEMIDT